MIEIENLKPFQKFCYTIGMIPTSYKESLTYEEQLIWFCDFLQNTVIPTVNNNGQAVTELQNLYIELKNYVDTYFENLDVQEEINNKLDAMVEAGTLQEIITAYLQIAGVLAFNNVEEMKNSTNLINGSFAKTFGFYNENDGGSSLYKIRNKELEEIPDEMFLIEINENIVAELIYNDKINIKQLGAIDNDANAAAKNTSIIQTCFDKDIAVIIPKGTFYITRLNMTGTKQLIGEEYRSSILKYNGEPNSEIVYIKGYGAFLENVSLICSNEIANINGIEFGSENPSEIIISKCYINVTGNGIIGGFNGSLNNVTIIDCFIENCLNGVNLQFYNYNQINAIFIKRNIIRFCSNAGILFYGNNVVIEENSIQANKYGISIGDINANMTEYKEQDCFSSSIIKNYFEQNTDYSILLIVGGTDFRNISGLNIEGNYLHRSEHGIYVDGFLTKYSCIFSSDERNVHASNIEFLRNANIGKYPASTIKELENIPYTANTNEAFRYNDNKKMISRSAFISGLNTARALANTQTRIIIYNAFTSGTYSQLLEYIRQSIAKIYINGYRDFGGSAQFSCKSEINGIGGRLYGNNTEIKSANSPIISPITYFENHPALTTLLDNSQVNAGFQIIIRNENLTNYNYFVDVLSNIQIMRGFTTKVDFNVSQLDETNDISSVTPQYLGQLIYNTSNNKWYYARTLTAWAECTNYTNG